MPRIVRSDSDSSSSSWIPLLAAGLALGAVVVWLATRRRAAGPDVEDSPFAGTELEHPGDPALTALLRAKPDGEAARS